MIANPLKRSFLCLTAEPGTVCAGLPTKKPRAAAVPITTQAAVQRQPSKSQFLSLPAELRNEIYSHALVQSTPISLPYAYETRSRTRSSSPNAATGTIAATYVGEPAFLRTSRLIRNEATPIYYGCNTFSAPSPASAHKFMKPLSMAKLSMLRFFRPVELVLELKSGISVRRRWEESVKRTVNRLVKECGKGSLSWESLQFAVKEKDNAAKWVGLNEVGFEIIMDEGGWKVAGPEREQALEGSLAT